MVFINKVNWRLWTTNQKSVYIEVMMKRLTHIIVLLAFVVSTVPGTAMTMPMAHQIIQKTVSQKAETSDAHHHVSDETKADHPCHDEKQSETKNAADDKQCCGGNCQCMMNGCATTQTFYNSSSSAYASISMKTMFMIDNEHYDDAIAYSLKHPPKA